MSGDSTQGVAVWAAADVASAVSASAATIVFIENLLILHSPNNLTGRPVFLNKSRTSFARQYDASRLATLSFHDAGFAAILRFQTRPDAANRDIRMKHLIKAGCTVALAVLFLAPAASANEYRLSNNQ